MADSAAIATVVSTIAFAASAIAVAVQLRQAARERYFAITAHLFEIRQSPEFQHDQLFLLHKLPCATWNEFCTLGRGEQPERALHRVGGYYDRIGNLVRHNLIHKDDILPTIGGYAIAVWDRIQPLVQELRLRENAVLFQNYESLLPECHDCYIPPVRRDGSADPLSSAAIATELFDRACAIDVASPVDLKDRSRLNHETLNDRPANPRPIAKDGEINEPPGSATNMNPETYPTFGNGMSQADRELAVGDLAIPDTDGISRRISEFSAGGRLVLIYARGQTCPFCLRQLADYGERYGEFKRSGTEVVTVVPEKVRAARRLRTGLKLPLTVLCDESRGAARVLGLLGRERNPNDPTPATVVLDGSGRVQLFAFNEGVKCLFARDVLEYVRDSRNASPQPPTPQLLAPKPGPLFARALFNMAASVFRI